MEGNISIENSDILGKPIIMLSNMHSVTIDQQDLGEIILENSSKISITSTKTNCILIQNSHNITIEDSKIEDGGIYIQLSSNITIHNNQIIGRKTTYTTFMGGIHMEIVNNTFVESNTIQNWTYGIYLPTFASISPESMNVIIKNNAVKDCDIGIHYSYVKGATIIQDTTIDNCNIGILENNYELYANNITIRNSKIGYHILSGNANISQASIEKNEIGFLIYYGYNITIKYSNIINNKIGILFNLSWIETVRIKPNLQINFNNIYSNTLHGLLVYTNRTPTLVDARYTWWGSPQGPEIKLMGDPEDPEEVWFEGNVTAILTPYSQNKISQNHNHMLLLGLAITIILGVIATIIILKKFRPKIKLAR